MRKDLPQKLFRGLLRNSKRSDRDLPKILKVSRPTITRTRHKLEKDAIEGYTIIPDWPKTDFKIFAFTFIKSKARAESEREAIGATKCYLFSRWRRNRMV